MDVNTAPFVAGAMAMGAAGPALAAATGHWPLSVLFYLLAIAAVPLFFYQTRRSLGGAAVGAGWGVAATLPALLLGAALVYQATHDSYDGSLSFDGRALSVDRCYTTDTSITLTDEEQGVVNLTRVGEDTFASFTTQDASTVAMFTKCGKLAMADDVHGTMKRECTSGPHKIAFDGAFACR